MTGFFMSASFFRLLAAALLFLSSLMVVVPATKVPFWYLVILVTELGHWLALASLGILVWELAAWRGRRGWFTLVLGVAAIGFYLTPLRQAVGIAAGLPRAARRRVRRGEPAGFSRRAARRGPALGA